MTRIRAAFIIAMIAVLLIIAGAMTMVPLSEQVPSQTLTPEGNPAQDPSDVRDIIGTTIQRLTTDDLSASSAGPQVGATSDPVVGAGVYFPYLEQQAEPLLAAETVTPNVPREPVLPPPDGINRIAKVPILMYHYISEPPPGADKIRKGLSVSPAAFEGHLRYLQEEGYRTISLYQLLLHLTRGEPLPPKPVILTFDDGYRDNYENAFPLLQQYGFTGTFFLITNFIDEGRTAYLTWDQVKELAQAGNEIGAHSRDHPDLRGKDTDFLVWQILGSREAIQNGAGLTPRFFSYPSGKYDENTVAIVASANYWGAVTVKQGVRQSSDAPFELQRIRIQGDYGVHELDWVLNYYMQP